MGKQYPPSWHEHSLTAAIRLLNIPMDYSLAFNQALKNIVVALPNRPPHETADDVVCSPPIVSTYHD